MPAVSVKGVSKKYRIFATGQDRLKETLSFGRKKYGRNFWALKGIDFDVEPGATLGILGRNGAGKSTLLSIISGLRQPTSGTVEVNGRLVALSGTGAGFNSEFTGRENVMLNGMLLGMKRQEILEQFDEIEAFADLGEFMDQPLKTYSSGMRSRLGFAVAINIDPDVLILDEALGGAGDAVYRDAAQRKVDELRNSGTTILLVSHNPSTIEQSCTEALLLNKGRLLASGETTEVADRYRALVESIKAQKENRRAGGGQRPDDVVSDEKGGVRIESVKLLDEHLCSLDAVAPMVSPNSAITVRVHLKYLEAAKDSQLRITLRNQAGLDVFSTSTAALNGDLLKEMEKDERVMVDLTFKVPLQDGFYSVTTATRAGSEDRYLDQTDPPIAFYIARPRGGSPYRGIVDLPTEIRVRAPEEERQGRFA